MFKKLLLLPLLISFFSYADTGISVDSISSSGQDAVAVQPVIDDLDDYPIDNYSSDFSIDDILRRLNGGDTFDGLNEGDSVTEFLMNESVEEYLEFSIIGIALTCFVQDLYCLDLQYDYENVIDQLKLSLLSQQYTLTETDIELINAAIVEFENRKQILDDKHKEAQREEEGHFRI